MKIRKIVLIAVSCFLGVILIAGNAVAAVFGEIITEFFQGREWDYSNLDMAAGDKLAQEIEAEGVVLLRNKNGVLPLTVAPMPVKEDELETLEEWTRTPVSVFGWGATDAGFIMGGSGSGSSTDRGGGNFKQFLQGMYEGGFELYQPLIDMMTSYHGARSGGPRHQNDAYPFFNLYEPSLTQYQMHLAGAKAHSNTAIVVISRLGGEGGDLEHDQRKWNGTGNDNNTTQDTTRTYLDISTDEEAMLNLVRDNFENVVVIINTCNAMNLSFLETIDVDAAVSIGAAGQAGALAVADILRGKKTVREVVTKINPETGNEEDVLRLDDNGDPIEDPVSGQSLKVFKRSEYAFSPSGKTVDTHVRNFKADPTYVNAGTIGVTSYTNSGKYVDYAEDIYFGYFYYETAHQLSLESKYVFNYDQVVQYPFGYGESYTKFEWEITNVLPSRGAKLSADDTIEINITVKNTGSHPGKEVVQLYYTAPYTEGGIEKPFVKLCAYAKTELIQPGGEFPVTLKFDVKDMASYDCYDKNGNSFAGYELDAGDYKIKLQSDAHTIATVSGGSATIEYSVETGIRYDKNEEVKTDILNEDRESTGKTTTKTLKAAQNLFTGSNAYGGVAIDGSNSGANIVYLTRANFTGTFPDAKKAARAKDGAAAFADGYAKTAAIEGAVAPTQGSNETSHKLFENFDVTKPNHELMMRLGANYDDELWDDFLNQIPLTGNVTGTPGSAASGGSLETIVGRGGWRTSHVDAIGKPWLVDLDGPSGLNTSVASDRQSSWTGFPVSTVLAQTWSDNLSYMYGLAVAAEAKATGVSGWYAPAMNMHRSPFMGRNFEYYSEDPLISGRMGAETSRGALTNGLYPYIKHFVVNDCETSRTGVYTWLTEQNLREMYLRPFEIAVKEGGANGVMSSFNRLGAIWTGGNKALLTDVLRDEWGFQGSVITDWTTGGAYMNVDQGLRAGNDLWLTGQQNMPSGFDDKSSNTAKMLMREAAKNQLFTLTNTYYISQTTEGEALVMTPPPPLGFPMWTMWGLLPIDIILVLGILVCVYFAFPIIRQKLFKKKPKNGSDATPAKEPDPTSASE